MKTTAMMGMKEKDQKTGVKNEKYYERKKKKG